MVQRLVALCLLLCHLEEESVCSHCGGSRGALGGSVEPPFGSLISMKNTDLNVYFCSKVPFRESTNPRSNPPSQNPGSAPAVIPLLHPPKQKEKERKYQSHNRKFTRGISTIMELVCVCVCLSCVMSHVSFMHLCSY